jgi:hypothetical protein
MNNEREPSPALFEQAEQPLIQIENVLAAYAEEIGGRLDVNYHGRPARNIMIDGKDEIVRQIELTTTLLQPEKGWIDGNWQYNLTLHAWKDVTAGRMTWYSHITKFDAAQLHAVDLENLLPRLWSDLNQVREEQMQLFANP